jgi:ribonuclease HII
MSSKTRHAPAATSRRPLLRFERRLWRRGITRVAGVDEVGRGPLAGPVVAAAVVFPPGQPIPPVADSKQLTGDQREILFDQIMAAAIDVGVGVIDHDVIDRVNILQATYQAMYQAIRQLALRPDYLLVDGNRFLADDIPFVTIIDGDARCASIAAASIVAKVTRDRMMLEYDRCFPDYGFGRHKGYPTREHCAAIRRLGYCTIHRRTFHVGWEDQVLDRARG